MTADGAKGQLAVIDCQVTEGIAQVTVSNPPRFNAMTRQMWRDLRSVFVRLQGDTSLRLIVVQGRGLHFCAGGDISEYPDFRFNENGLRQFHESDVWGGLSAMLECDVPMVAAIRGNCMGAGVEIASCCDVRLADSSSRFGAPIAKLGFPMAPREAELVVSALGVATAREMLLTGAIFDAAEVKARGFLQHVVAPEHFDDEVARLARKVGVLSPQAGRLNKQTIRALTSGSPMEGILATAYSYAGSAEHREGIQSFLEKRAPRFG